MLVAAESIPMALTLSRLPLTTVGYWFAFIDPRPVWVFVIALACVATDILDGMAARRLDVASDRGANVDSMVDFVFYASLLVWTIAFTPELLEVGLGPVIGAFFASYALLFLAGIVLARNVAVHTAMSRIVATIGTAAALSFILWGFRWWIVAPVILVLLADVVQRVMFLGRHLKTARGAEAD